MVPFGVMSYLLGLTSVHFKQYLLGTMAVMLHIPIWLYVGSTFTCFDFSGDPQKTKPPTSSLEKFVLIL